MLTAPGAKHHSPFLSRIAARTHKVPHCSQRERRRCGVWVKEKGSINTRSEGLGGRERRDISLHPRVQLSQKEEGEERGRQREQGREEQEREIEGAEPTRTVRMAA